MKKIAFAIILLLFLNITILPIRAQELTPANQTPAPTSTPTLSPSPDQQTTPTATEIEETTSEASSSAVVENDVNSEIVGENINKQVVNVVDNSLENINVASASSAPQSEENDTNTITQSEIQIKNEAKVENDLDISSNTGNVDASDSADIVSGNASTDIAIANLVNTNLVGSCGFFGIVNIFASQEGDIILPNEEEYIDKQNCNPSIPSAAAHDINTTNSAEVTNTVTSEATAGDNKGSTVTTGSSQTTVNVLNTLNTNIVGDNWVYIRITDFGNWKGQIIGARSAIAQEDGSYIVRFNLPVNNESPSSGSTSIDNETVIHNTVKATATTGDNEIQGNEGAIKTGDAKVNVDIVNIANTNIIGNNWFFALISNFDSFHGNIIIPRPNLSIQQSKDIDQIEEGGEVTIRIGYVNNGSYPAKNTIITLNYPGNFNLSESDDGVVSGSSLVWNVGTLLPATAGIVSAKFKLIQKSDVKNFPFTSSITTSSYEPLVTDNVDSILLGFKEKSITSNSVANNIVTDTNNEDQYSVIQSPLTRFYITPVPQQVLSNRSANIQRSAVSTKSEVKGTSIKKMLPLESSVCTFGLVGCRNIVLSLISTFLFGLIVLLRKRKIKV